MTTGEKIKLTRKYKNITQKQLAIKSGMSEPAIRNYELDNRIPSEMQIKKIADALDVSVFALSKPKLESATSAMYILFEFEKIYGFDVTENKFTNNNIELNAFLEFWAGKKCELNDGKIKEKDYIEWKLNFEKFIEGL